MKFAKKLLVIAIIVFIALMSFACKTSMQKRATAISEFRDEVLVGKKENVDATLISGYREEPFNVDGTSNAVKKDFAVLSVECVTAQSELEYCMQSSNATFKGTLVKHPLKNSYSVELDERITGSATLQVSLGDNVVEIMLNSVRTSDMITPDVALDIAESELKKEIKQMNIDGDFSAEIFIRLLKNPINSEGGYFWYVAYAEDKYVVKAVLIHPITREIYAKKTE